LYIIFEFNTFTVSLILLSFTNPGFIDYSQSETELVKRDLMGCPIFFWSGKKKNTANKFVQ
jgi:hypothetical protein